MGWAKGFYTRQYELLKSPAVWATFSPNNLPERAKRRAEAVERLAGPGAKQILELGCGGGIMAGAIALRGNTVVAVDIVDAAVASARRLAAQIQTGQLTVVHGDFYTIALEDKFDVVCYFDGFGVGADADQRRLLRRMAAWLKPGGCALIDIYCPWAFANNMGEVYQEGDVMSRSGFDADGCRLEDTIWFVGEDESHAVTQSLRCYSPADLRLLLEGTGLALHTIEPYASAWDYDKPVPLQDAEIYLTKLVPEG
jgi:SAM-dependent methyltransferase